MTDGSKIVLGVAALGGLVGVGLLLTRSQPSPLPSANWQTYAGAYSQADVEAGARMLASENPRGSKRLHIEQVYTQLRARRAGESLFDRITADSGWGRQGESAPGGRIRPVSTDQPASEAQRLLVSEILDGLHPSEFRGARKFFEPAVMDRALAVANRAREKRAQGLVLTKQEQRLIHYKRTADEVRKKWLGEGSKFVSSADGVEFYT